MTYEPHRNRDVSFLNASHLWPLWPRCPVKRGQDNQELGVAFRHGEVFRVYIMNLFDTPTKDTKYIDYLDGTAAVADGWKVD